ncbi:MAG: hypothetical protein JXA24_02950 [Proteobacteria bacterium]|nr:hypothetical protein [Pseudomonadota bacterium]
MPPMFRRNYHEVMPGRLARLFKGEGITDLKARLWNSFVDSGLVGITDHDCSALPRILPMSYLPVIRRAARDITECLMKILSLPEREILSVLPAGPIARYLVEELGVLRHRPRRLTGSMRFDMAVVGRPGPNNPPVLMEVNEIGFDGIGRSSYIQETLLSLFPELREQVRCLDTAAAEVRNMRRLGRSLARFHYDSYTWEEESILMKAAKAGLDITIVQPPAFRVHIDEECRLMRRERVSVKDGRLVVGGRAPSSCMVAYSFELKDYKEAPDFFRMIIRSKTPQYSPFITGLVAPKTILVILSDKSLVRRLLGSARAKRLSDSVLRAGLLPDRAGEIDARSDELVLKHADGMGGERVFVGREAKRRLHRIRLRDAGHWVVQDRIHINTMDIDGFLSRRRRVIADLGVYVQYDWNGREFLNFEVGGFITRATNRSLKVNVSGGGCQVPVMFDRSR